MPQRRLVARKKNTKPAKKKGKEKDWQVSCPKSVPPTTNEINRPVDTLELSAGQSSTLFGLTEGHREVRTWPLSINQHGQDPPTLKWSIVIQFSSDAAGHNLNTSKYPLGPTWTLQSGRIMDCILRLRGSSGACNQVPSGHPMWLCPPECRTRSSSGSGVRGVGAHNPDYLLAAVARHVVTRRPAGR